MRPLHERLDYTIWLFGGQNTRPSWRRCLPEVRLRREVALLRRQYDLDHSAGRQKRLYWLWRAVSRLFAL